MVFNIVKGVLIIKPNNLNKRLKVLHLITDLDTGGAEMMLCKLVQNMDVGCFDNVVVSILDKGKLEPCFKSAGVRVYNLGFKKAIDDILGFYRLIRIISMRNRICCKHGYIMQIF